MKFMFWNDQNFNTNWLKTSITHVLSCEETKQPPQISWSSFIRCLQMTGDKQGAMFLLKTGFRLPASEMFSLTSVYVAKKKILQRKTDLSVNDCLAEWPIMILQRIVFCVWLNNHCERIPAKIGSAIFDNFFFGSQCCFFSHIFYILTHIPLLEVLLIWLLLYQCDPRIFPRDKPISIQIETEPDCTCAPKNLFIH